MDKQKSSPFSSIFYELKQAYLPIAQTQKRCKDNKTIVIVITLIKS